MKFLQIFIFLLFTCTLKLAAQFTPPSVSTAKTDSLPVVFPFNPLSVSANTISSDYYKKNLGFFCLKELQVEKALKVPLKFRLGGLEYCNYLEGKNRPYR